MDTEQQEVCQIIIFGNLNFSILNNETKNKIGGIGAQISHRLIKLWFGVAAFLIPIISLIIGLKILGFKKFNLSKIIFNCT